MDDDGEEQRPVDEAALKIEARLQAIEYLLGDAIMRNYLLAGLTEQQIEDRHAAIDARLRRETLPGVPAATADVVLDEVQFHVRALLAYVERTLKAARRRGGG